MTNVDQTQADLDAMIYERVVSGISKAPQYLAVGFSRENLMLALPLSVQGSIVRVISKLYGHGKADNHALTTFHAYKVVLGYEWAGVIFHPEAALDPANGIFKFSI